MYNGTRAQRERAAELDLALCKAKDCSHYRCRKIREAKRDAMPRYQMMPFNRVVRPKSYAYATGQRYWKAPLLRKLFTK